MVQTRELSDLKLFVGFLVITEFPYRLMVEVLFFFLKPIMYWHMLYVSEN